MDKNKMERARAKILGRLADAGSDGLTRSELNRAVQAPADHMAAALAELAALKMIVYQEERRAYQLGRKPTRIWHKDHAPILTPPAPDDTPTHDPDSDESPLPGGTCHQCGSRTPMVFDHVQDYCSETCRQLAATGGITRKSLLIQATSPHVFVELCILFVMEDLLLRGWYVARDVFRAGPRLIVTDGRGGCAELQVLPIPNSGTLPALDTFDSVAVVYTDGRIKYAGKNPLVIEEPAVDNGPASER